VSDLTTFADYFLICTGNSGTHVQALADGLEAKAREVGLPAPGVEGLSSARWVLLDFGDVVVHVMRAQTRAFYNLEKLWSEGKRLR